MVTSPAVNITAAPPAPPELPAFEAARSNWAANLAALSSTQQLVAASVRHERPDVRWTFGRDESLTAFGPDGKWWHGCSVPLAAADAMLASIDVQGRVACLLRPSLAAHVRVALRRSRPDQAIIALSPEPADLPVLLHCDDFSSDIHAHRLWFAWGPDWPAALEQLFADRPGLATPTQFIRLPTTPAEDVDALVSAAQPVFAAAAAARAGAVQHRREQWHRPAAAGRRRLCVVAPSHFRLWDDAGSVLADSVLATRATEHADVITFDPDDPAHSSALALLEAADGCHAVISADFARADLPAVLPPTLPWVTWATRPASIPSADAAAPDDALVVTEPHWRQLALDRGWPADKIRVAGWPPIAPAAGPAQDVARRPSLAIVADTVPIIEPERLAEFSSHRLLWHHIATELAVNPFALRDDAAKYLKHRMRRHAVSSDGFDAALFLRHLILPAYAQGVARILLRAGLPARLYGCGWDRIDEFAAAAGPVTSASDLARVARESTAIVDVSPIGMTAPIERLGRPVVRRETTANAAAFCDAARRTLAGGRPDAPAAEPVSLRMFLSLLST